MRGQYSDVVETARLRRGAYRLLASLFLYPNEQRLDSLVPLARDFQGNGPSLTRLAFYGSWQRLLIALQALSTEDQTAEIEDAFVRLFLVNARAPLLESSYLDPHREVAGWIAAQLSREYAEQGLVLSPAMPLIPDHLAVELEFMAFLCTREIDSWTDEAVEEGLQTLSWQQDFLDRHLTRWCSPFAGRVANADGEGLYAVAARAADAFIQHDLDLIVMLQDRIQTITCEH